MTETLSELRDELKRRGLQQVELIPHLQALGLKTIDESLLSRYLNNRRDAPEGFAEMFTAAVELAAREKAARLLGSAA
jgi:hypothetical protein